MAAPLLGWHDTPPDPRESGPGHVYVCRDCNWSGRGGAAAFDHHRAQPAHRIVLRDAPQLGPIAWTCGPPVTKED
jgi:hypothetical protein